MSAHSRTLGAGTSILLRRHYTRVFPGCPPLPPGWSATDNLIRLFQRHLQWQHIAQQPGHARLSIGCDQIGRLCRIVLRQSPAHDHIKRAAIGAVSVDVGDHGSRRLWRRGQDGKAVIADLHLGRTGAIPARGPAEGTLVGPIASHPDWYTRLLHRLGQKGGFFELIIFSLVTKRCTAPQPNEDVQTLIELIRTDTRIALLAKLLE